MISANLKKKPLLFIACVLVLTSMACRFGSNVSNEPTPFIINEPIPSDSNDAESIFEDIQSQIGTFAFTVTEDEMASYLTLKMSENQEQAPVENLAVNFQDNQITVSGDVLIENIGIKVPVEIGLVAKVDENGQLYFEIVSIKVANMQLPEGLEQSLSTAITDVMNSQFANYLSGYKIESVYVNGGLLTISGKKR
jgi:uncharacterized protein YpmS